jgi:predicted lipase
MGTVELFISDPETDVQVGITKSDTNKRISVVFRGSESKSDWYYDLMIAKRNIGNNVWVHTGFYHQLHTNNVFETIVQKVNNLLEENPDYDVFVTGHSLGAALSTLFGYEYGITTDKKICVVSFASPRVGNFKFKQEFEERNNLCHYRVSNNRDIITATPMFKYYHCGKNICLYEDKFETNECDDISWWRYSIFYCWSVADHGVKLYYDRLIKNLW